MIPFVTKKNSICTVVKKMGGGRISKEEMLRTKLKKVNFKMLLLQC